MLKTFKIIFVLYAVRKQMYVKFELSGVIAPNHLAISRLNPPSPLAPQHTIPPMSSPHGNSFKKYGRLIHTHLQPIDIMSLSNKVKLLHDGNWSFISKFQGCLLFYSAIICLKLFLCCTRLLC